MPRNRIINKGGKIAIILCPSSVENISNISGYIFKRRNKIKESKSDKLYGLKEGFVKFKNQKPDKSLYASKNSHRHQTLNRIIDLNLENYTRPLTYRKLSQPDLENEKIVIPNTLYNPTCKRSTSQPVVNQNLKFTKSKSSMFITDLKP